MVLLALSLNFAGCFLTEENETESSTYTNLEDLMTDVTQNDVTLPENIDAECVKATEFSLELFKETNEDGKNTLISPISVLYALSMTANGADGETLEQMESVLGMSTEELNIYLYAYINSLPKSEKYKLSIANSIWFKDDGSINVNQGFLQINADYYGADIYKAKFDRQTLKDINGWVNNKTDGMIPEVINEIPAEAVMYLINALAFDAEWESPYSEWDVYDGKFKCEDGTDIDVKMMRGSDGFYLEDEKATGFMKFYDGRKYAFVALLPNEGISVSDYVLSLDGQSLQATLNNPLYGVALYTSMPKFTVEYDVEMSGILKDMGMVDAFDSSAADFSSLGVSEAGNIFINRVIHKTFIEVGELGTRAGAATAVEINEESAPEVVKQVHLDRPFVYMLIDWENKVPFFVGSLCEVETDSANAEENKKYNADLSKYPTNEDCMGYGKIIEIENGRLLISPGGDADKKEFGELVWLICNEAEAYSVGQVVTYIFRDVQAPDREGEPLKIIAKLVYME
jgi:serpin B